tara:strand:+ start:553 stop:2268 length:1716 start_codon:yes stop_codon:yes gene_type:complete
MRKYLLIVTAFLLFGCSKNTKSISDEKLIVSLADDYFYKTIETHPEYAYYADIPLEKHNSISSNELSDIKLWENYEDSLYTELKKIDELKLNTQRSKITYWFLKEDLESSIAMRICKRNLWNVDPENSWQTLWLAVAQIQPIGTDTLRTQALERWSKLPEIIKKEINNLKLGISQGYTMPKEIVNAVINQLQVLVEIKIDESPFMLPAKRDGNKEFYVQWENLVQYKIIPSIENYINFLNNEYIKEARQEVSILKLPNGNQCYQAYIRKYTTTNKTGKEIFELGQKTVSSNKKEIEMLGEELYNTSTFNEIITNINKDTSNYFKSSKEILETTNHLMIKAEKECENWFAILPKSTVTVKPYEAFEKGSGAYEQGNKNKPAYFRINLNNPTKQKKGANEVLTFHEAYPGHHIQIALEKEIKNSHPIAKLIGFTSYVEGWARYTEQLAEEMNLYENKSALIKRRAWPYRGMVVDAGIHTKNWSKEKAINYIVESGMSREIALNLYHRSITMPAQLTSYDIGGEEIKSLRKEAKERLNEKFEIKEFHNKILENGAIPLSALRIILENWIDDKSK